MRKRLFSNGTTSHATSIAVPDNGDVVVTVRLANSYSGELMQSEFYRLPANTTEMVKLTLQSDEE
ncbi:MAG: hypothetical protein ACM3ME_08890 [Chloroflexota bacterium]|nr:hypothetical protein [Lentimicrobium sp.]